MDLENIRTDYQLRRLRREDLTPEPFRLFEQWMQEAITAALIEPTAMILATASKDSRPLTRTVLLKHFDARGFVFFTNFESRKAMHIAENPQVSLLFPWLALERQVIITGTAEKIPTIETLKYFASRPRESQIGAWASRQSSAISSRKFLEMQWEKMKEQFGNGQIPLPSFWGGYRVVPATIEFWQGRPKRLHDRFQYSRQEDGSWNIVRLSP